MIAGPEVPRWKALLLVFSLGFFAFVAQTLLFRDFLTVFEGSEFGLASFFCSWLAGLSLGAWAGRWSFRLAGRALRRLEWLGLCYLPAFLLQSWLVAHARDLAGVRPFELFAFWRMLPVALLANAPVSVVTGLLFAWACAWMEERHSLPVARVYIWETAGSVAGGASTTLLLVWGLASGTIALCAVLCLGLGMVAFRRRLGLLTMALATALLVLGAGPRWDKGRAVNAWSRLLPSESFQGVFHTPQARYLHGVHRGQFIVMSWEAVTETLPETEQSSEVVAVHLAQAPKARNVLVVGPGSLALCRRWLEVPDVRVAWLHPDPEYPARLLSILPTEFRAGLERLDLPGRDPRTFLREEKGFFDLVVVNSPSATALVMNRCFSREFFELVKTRLAPGGVISVRLSGGENYLGDERVQLGASLVRTLGAVFPHLALKPGDESWLFGSEADVLTENRRVLAVRYASVPGAEAIYPSASIPSLFPGDRIRFQRKAYEAAIQKSPADFLLNTDAHPKASLFALMIESLQSGRMAWFARGLGRAAATPPWAFVVCLLLLALLRLLYRARQVSAGGAGGSTYDACWLVLSMGWAGLSLSLVLMFLYQLVQGSLFLHMGLISALFMLGLALGGQGVAWCLLRGLRPSRLLAVDLGFLLTLLAALAIQRAALSGPALMALFFPAGLLCGAVIPPATRLLEKAGQTTLAMGAELEVFDNLGGMLGALLTGLILIPAQGVSSTLIILMALVLSNLPVLWPASAGEHHAGLRTDRQALRAGYVLAAAVLLLAIFTRASATAPAGEDPLFRKAAQSLAAGRTVTERVTRGERPVRYYSVAATATGRKGWIYSAGDFAPDISGYGGPISLAVRVDEDGQLLGLEVYQSNETPAYFQRVQAWMKTLSGLNLFQTEDFNGVDGVSGATASRDAVLALLRISGPAFAAEVLGKEPASGCPWRPGARGWDGALVLALLGLVVWARRKPAPWRRRVVLLAVVLGLGVLLNAQVSMHPVLSLVAGPWLSPSWTVAFLLFAGVPMLVLLLGNVYCGWLCPFGALQELLGDLRPARWRTDPPKSFWRYGRWVKYLLLWVFLLIGLGGGPQGIMEADPLVHVFHAWREHAVSGMVLALLAASFFFRRFWCRNLCPAGAFLAILSGVRLLRRILPVLHPGRCDLGVLRASDLDCLQCDRCRMPRAQHPPRMARWPAAVASGLFALCVAAAAGGLFWKAWSGRMETTPAVRQAGASSVGQSRNVSAPQLKRLIEEGRLSDREAAYYQTVEPE